MFKPQIKAGNYFEKRMQKTRRLPGGGKHHRNPLNVAVDSHAHPVMPLIKGILNAQIATEHDIQRKAVVIAVPAHAVRQLPIELFAFALGHFVFGVGELIGIFRRAETALDFKPPDFKRIDVINIAGISLVFVTQHPDER